MGNTVSHVTSNGITTICIIAALFIFILFYPRKLSSSYVIALPPRSLLLYLIGSYAFITICLYYMLIWQFLYNNLTLLPIIILEEIVFAIKVPVDFAIYFPKQCFLKTRLNIDGYSPWTLRHESMKKHTSHQRKWCIFLFNPFSISLYICTLTLSFIILFDGRNADFIEWHSLLSLLILSAINEYFNQYACKALASYDQNEHISFLLTRKFGKNISNLIWTEYANQNQLVRGHQSMDTGLL